MVDDFRLAWRRLRHSPGFALLSVVTLALAVGANTAVFTVADAVLFRPLPYGDPDRLFVVRSVDATTGHRLSAVPFEYVRAIRDYHSGVAGVALRSTTIFTNHVGDDGAESIETLVAAPDYFQVLGVQPFRGRLFENGDVADGHRTAILTHESWRRRFGSDETTIGRTVKLGPETRTVVGVLPPGFIFPSASLRRLNVLTGRAEYVTVAAPPSTVTSSNTPNAIIRGGHAMDAVVRLKRGITREQAQAELDVLAAAVRANHPEHDSAVVLDDLRSLLFPTGRKILALLLVSASLVLLIGCANLAHMLIARTDRRQHELAIHAALGATRLRVMRPLFLETLIIGGVAAALAVAATALTFDILLREVPPAAYGRAVIGVDTRVAAFSLMLGVAGGLLFAVVPAWRASRLDVQAVIRRANHRLLTQRHRGGRSMIGAQVALAILLVVGAVTAARNLIGVLNAPLGFNPKNIITVDAHPGEREPRRRFYERAIAVLKQRPDVISAGAGSSTPFYNLAANEASAVSRTPFREVQVLPGYLDTLQVRVTHGRLPAQDDFHSDMEPAVLSKSAARRLFPDRLAVGETYETGTGRSFRIVGIVQDEIGSIEKTGALVYIVPRDVTTPGLVTIVVRTRARSAATLAGVRSAVASLVPSTEPVSAAWMSDSIEALNSYRNPRFQAVLLGAFAVLALGLAALGVFAVVAAVVAARTREMGIRLAIGAPPSTLIRQVVREALVPIAAGIVIGTAAAQVVGRFAQAEIAALDIANLDALAIAAVVVTAAASLAAYVPARRAARVDPISILRAE
jgi:predicted permease